MTSIHNTSQTNSVTHTQNSTLSMSMAYGFTFMISCFCCDVSLFKIFCFL